LETVVNDLTTEELFAEFEMAYKRPEVIPQDSDAVIILTADGVQPAGKEENLSRIRHGLGVWRMLFKNWQVPFIFNGVTEEKELALWTMEEFRLSSDIMHFQDCGQRGSANTKTQMEAINRDSLTRYRKKLVLVTDTYHIPRTKRTAGRHLPQDVQFVVTSNPEDWRINNTAIKIIGEIDRIRKYSAKGDILLRPR
jgi:hypothetical protein